MALADKQTCDTKDHAAPVFNFSGTFFLAAFLCSMYPLVNNALISTKVYAL